MPSSQAGRHTARWGAEELGKQTDAYLLLNGYGVDKGDRLVASVCRVNQNIY